MLPLLPDEADDAGVPAISPKSTADYYPFPHEVLSRTGTRVINEVRGINRVVYDLTSKPLRFGAALAAGPTDTHAGTLCFMSLPWSEAVMVGEALNGRDMTPPTDILFVTPALNALAKLRRLHEAAGDLAEHAPAVLAQPEAARA